MARKSSEIELDAPGIDEASETVADFLEDIQLDRKNALSVRLSLENSLIRLSERFGEEATATFSMDTWLGRPRIVIKVQGERFDPRDIEAQSDWERMLLESSGLSPVYSYRGGHNIVTTLLPRKPLSGTLISSLAIVLGVILANAGMHLSAGVRDELLTNVVTPLFTTFIGMLSGIAGPMVFLSVAWGICGIGDMAALGRSGKALVVRFLGVDFLATFFALVTCIPLIPLAGSIQNAESPNRISDVFGLLLELLPTNIITPFTEGNTLQIIVLAVATGVGALALGNETEGLRTALRELNVLVQFLMGQLCRLLPAFIVVMMVYQTWSGTFSDLLSSWRPIIILCVCVAAFLAVQIAVVAARSGVTIGWLFKALFPSLFLSFTTASSSATFGTMLSCCKDDLEIDDNLASFAVPLGMVLSKTSLAIQLVAFMLFAAQIMGIEADVAWYARLSIICLLYTVAIPPVPGGSLACYGMMLSGLGIPAQALGVLTALDLLLDNPVTSGNVGGLILQVFSAAKSLGLTGREKRHQER